MTIFYRFQNKTEFEGVSNETKSSTLISVIGERYNCEGMIVDYIVNAISMIPGWESFQVFPETPIRIFG